MTKPNLHEELFLQPASGQLARDPAICLVHGTRGQAATHTTKRYLGSIVANPKMLLSCERSACIPKSLWRAPHRIKSGSPGTACFHRSWKETHLQLRAIGHKLIRSQTQTKSGSQVLRKPAQFLAHLLHAKCQC